MVQYWTNKSIKKILVLGGGMSVKSIKVNVRRYMYSNAKNGLTRYFKLTQLIQCFFPTKCKANAAKSFILLNTSSTFSIQVSP